MISIENIYQAKMKLKDVIVHTPLMYNLYLSEKYECNIYLKREDLQTVRSYKIRGAYHKMASLEKEEIKKGIVCASAGNHAQGVALACHQLNIKGKIFMPETTPQQKIGKVKRFGKNNIEIILVGDTFDDAYKEAIKDSEKNNKIFIHPFNDEKIIEGQGTVGLEILEDIEKKIDYLLVAIGGGGLASGVGSCFQQLSPQTKIIGVEPQGAAAMKKSIEENKIIKLEHIDSFVDGAAVKEVGTQTFNYCKKLIEEIILVPEGKVCTTILELYNEEAIVVEPAGALTIAALDQVKDQIKGKTIVCLISGGNNDITRMEEIKERSLIFEGLKHYFMINFPQRAGALKEFVNHVLGPNDDITFFQYTKKNSREKGPALVGIELKSKKDYEKLIQQMEEYEITYTSRNDHPHLFDLII